MYQLLKQSLLKLENEYLEGVQISNYIFDSLVMNKIRELPALTNQQSERMANIRNAHRELQDIIREIAVEKNEISEPPHIAHILKYFPQSEKEFMLDKSRQIHQLELQLQRVFMRNGDFLTSIMTAEEEFIDFLADSNESNLLNEQY